MPAATLDVELIRRRLRAGAADGLRVAVRDLGQRSNARAPRLTGALRQSQHEDVDDDELVGTVFYTTPYAARIHEDTRNRQLNGGQAKFLETALADGADHSLELIASAIREEFRS